MSSYIYKKIKDKITSKIVFLIGMRYRTIKFQALFYFNILKRYTYAFHHPLIN